MLENETDLEDFLIEQMEKTLMQGDAPITEVSQVMGVDPEDYGTDFEKMLDDMEKASSDFDKKLDDFVKFIYNWQENVAREAEEKYKEDYSDEYKDFESFLQSKDGQVAMEMANDTMQQFFEDDEWLSEIEEMLRRHGYEIHHEHEAPVVIRRFKEEIDEDLDRARNVLLREVPKDAIREIFKEDQF
jgi:hypothetical protein